MVRLFKGTCEAVRAMHDYRGPLRPAQSSQQQHKASSSRQQQQDEEDSGRHSDDDERFPQPEGDGDDGYSYGSASVPLVTKHRAEEEGDDRDEEMSSLAQNGNVEGDSGATEPVPYAHRDLKPG